MPNAAPNRMWSMARSAVDLGHTAEISSGPDGTQTLRLKPAAISGAAGDLLAATWELTDLHRTGDGLGGWHIREVTLTGRSGVAALRVRDIDLIVRTWSRNGAG